MAGRVQKYRTTEGSFRRRLGAGAGAGMTARLASNRSRSAGSIRKRGRPFWVVAALIAGNSPLRIQARILSTETPNSFATSRGRIFYFWTDMKKPPYAWDNAESQRSCPKYTKVIFICRCTNGILTVRTVHRSKNWRPLHVSQ